MLKPFNPFNHVNIREAIRNLDCSGNETHISQCDIDSVEVEDCGQFEIAGVVCQGIIQQQRILYINCMCRVKFSHSNFYHSEPISMIHNTLLC